MLFCFADVITLSEYYPYVFDIREEGWLESYHRMVKTRTEGRVMAKKKIFLDSGAYSAWTKGITIDIDKYIAFIKEYEDCIEVYANLDQIPATPGRHPEPWECEEAAEKSWTNLKYMEECGLSPMPIYHQGEDEKWLLKMLDGGYTYIGISPQEDKRDSEKKVWLDGVFSLLVDEEGWPVVKTHGYGVTGFELMMRYPWFSVDSTSWVLTSRFGTVFVPRFEGGQYVYDKQPFKIAVSERSSDLGVDGSKHFMMLPDIDKEKVTKYFELKGTTIEELSTDYKARDKLNIEYYLDFEKNFVSKPFIPQRSGWDKGSFKL